MSSHSWRFLAEQIDPQTWQISGDEAEHLSRVLRLETGDTVEVTDGAGQWATGELRNHRGKIILVDCGTAQQEPPPRWRITMAIGALKPGVIDEVLPGLVELGVDRILIFQQAGMAKSRLSDSAIERWRRILVSSIKQCKRARLPNLNVFASLGELLKQVDGHKIVLDSDASSPLFEMISPIQDDVVFLVGGERGLDAQELQAIQGAGFATASLGPNILRAVTAAAAVAAVATLRRAATTC